MFTALLVPPAQRTPQSHPSANSAATHKTAGLFASAPIMNLLPIATS